MRAEIEVLAADPDAAATDIEASTAVLRRQLGRSEELINALLALARSQPELLEWEDVDLADVAREALEHVAATAAERPLHVEATLEHAKVHADRRLIALLVTNLLDNAIKHNREDGWLAIRTATNPDRAVLMVANSGPTVRADELVDLTQPFRRGGRARTGDGHGLGLAIVAAVASAHRGRLTIQTPTDGGLRIEVSLPTAAIARAHNGTGATERLLAREHST
jgi:signal transduction histidine kinase